MSATNNITATSREDIVQLLRARERTSADELAEALGVSKQCVRKHLEILERDGYVKHAPERGERGRPLHVYRLTLKADELFPKRYDVLAKSILRQISSVWGERGLDVVFCGCAEELVADLRPHLMELDFDARVCKLAELLAARGYEAEVERLEDGSFLLTEWNCPVSEVARDYRQMCDKELGAYRELLGAEVFRETRIAGGATRCTYRVLPPKKRK